MEVRVVFGGRAACVMAVVLALSVSGVFAQSTWNVTADGNWNVDGNWDPVGVPNSSTTDVLIDDNPDHDVTVTLNMDADVRNLTVNAGDKLHISGGRRLSMFGDLTNYGWIRINPAGSASTSTLNAVENMVLSGMGGLQLGRTAGTWAADIRTEPGKTITQEAGHTIAGVGDIYASLVNHGMVRADSSLGYGSELRLLTNNKVNTGLFEAVADSTLNISGIDVTNTGAVIRAQGAGAVVEFTGIGRIIGGTLETLDGGVFTSTGTRTLENVTLAEQGVLQVVGGVLAAEGTLTNHGLIQVNPTGSSSVRTFNASDDLLLTGTGMLTLGREAGTWAAQITTAEGKTITQQVDHTIAGVGDIHGRLLNYGTLRADASLGSGSLLRVADGALANYDAGTQTLSGGSYEVIGNSTMRLVGADIHTLDAAILLEGAGAGLFSSSSGSVSALADLTTITAAGSLVVSNSASLAFTDTVSNFGLIGGNGTLTGNIDNAGTISPGNSTGTLSIVGDIGNSGAATLLIEVAGAEAGQWDMLKVAGGFDVDGVLSVRFLPGAEGLLAGDVLTIVDAATLTGTSAFSMVQVEAAGAIEVLYNHNDGLIQLTGFQDIVPIPEPATMALLALGGLALIRRRSAG